MSFLDDGLSNRRYGKGEVVHALGEANDGIYCIAEGLIGVRKMDAEGNWILLHLAYPGETLGYRSFLSGGRHRTSAEALEKSSICHVASDRLANLLAHEPHMALQFLRHATRELETAHDELMQNLSLTNRQHFVHLLMILHKRHGTRNADGSMTIQLPMSRRDIASMIGTRHETLSRIIGRLESDGLATFSGRQVHVADVDALFEEIAAYFPVS